MNIDKKKDDNQWYATETEAIVTLLSSDTEKGLTHERAGAYLQQYGENRLPGNKKESPIIRFLKHFNDILIYILFIAALISAVLGHYVDTIVIALVAIVNAAIGFYRKTKLKRPWKILKSVFFAVEMEKAIMNKLNLAKLRIAIEEEYSSLN